MNIRIYADFNSTNENQEVELNTIGSMSDIQKLSTVLQDGMLVVLYDDDLEVLARLKRTQDGKYWVGIPDWTTRRFIK